MGGKSPIVASDEQRVALAALAEARDRGEADRARAVLLTVSGWSSPQIAEAFGVRQDTVRLWRSDFGRGGVDALRASIAPGEHAVLWDGDKGGHLSVWLRNPAPRAAWARTYRHLK